MTSTNLPLIVQTAQQNNSYLAATQYTQLGLSIIPLQGKRPALKSWKAYQQRPATQREIDQWRQQGLFNNVGIVCGEVSDNLVVFDLDGAAGYPAFEATFPKLADTYTIATGGGVGKHVYFKVGTMLPSVKAMNTPIGNLELCGEGRQVVVPPSIHPVTGKVYQVEIETNILKVDALSDLVKWIESFKPQEQPSNWEPPQRLNLPSGNATINPRVIDAIAHELSRRNFKQHGDWLHGSCIHPEQHQNGDRNPSFGFNAATSYGHCYVCGTMLAKDICRQLNIDPDILGGLIEKETAPQITPSSNANPVDLNQLPEIPALSEKVDYRLPSWLEQYMDWAGKTGNQTPMIFHQAAGLWLLSTDHPPLIRTVEVSRKLLFKLNRT